MLSRAKTITATLEPDLSLALTLGSRYLYQGCWSGFALCALHSRPQHWMRCGSNFVPWPLNNARLNPFFFLFSSTGLFGAWCVQNTYWINAHLFECFCICAFAALSFLTKKFTELFQLVMSDSLNSPTIKGTNCGSVNLQRSACSTAEFLYCF